MPARLSLALLSGGLLALAFPPAELSALAFIALVPLLAAVEGVSPLRAFLLGWAGGLVFFGAVVWWVTVAMINYGGLPAPVGWLILALMASILALYPGVFAMAAAWASRRVLFPGARGVLFTAAIWTALEWIRGHFIVGGFPWANIAYSQYLRLPFIQTAALAGPYGPGFLLVAANAGVFCLRDAVRGRGRDRRSGAVGFAVALLLLAVGWAWGARHLGEDAAAGQPIRVAVIQGNMEQGIKWNAAFRESTVRTYEELTRQAAAAGAQVVLWPESAAPFYFQNEPAYQERIIGLAKSIRVPILFGVPAFEAGAGGTELRNRALYLNASGRMDGFYDKMHLVPFGEYVPLKNVLSLAGKLVQEVGDFTPGRRTTLFAVAGERFGTVICYEIIFPDLVRRFVREGATFMTTITNDAWYERSSASLQHFTQMVFRAVENGVPIARAANTGISGFVDARGRIVQMSGLFVRGYYLREIRPRRGSTVYTRCGDAFALICLLVLVGWAAAAAGGARRRRSVGRVTGG